MAEAFVRAGHEVVYWTGDFNHGTKARRVFSSPPAADGIEVRILPVMPYRRNVSLKRALSHMAYAREWLARGLEAGAAARPDLIVAACPTIGSAAAALKLARRFSAKMALDVMDAWPETFERLAPGVLRPLARVMLTPLRWQVRQLYRNADIVSGVCRRYRELSGRSDYFLAYHGIENALARYDSPVGRRSGDGRLKLVYAGNLGVGYDLSAVFAGMEILRKKGIDVSLVIAGKGPLEGKWRSLAPESVEFLGYLPGGQLEKTLEECDVGIVPLAADSWVGLPYKLGDYAKAGLKTLSCLDGECRSILEESHAGAWYRPGDGESFATAALSLLPSLDDRRRVRKLAARLDAATIYDEYVRAATALFAQRA
jgi:glycosyltransferase involved in cell wall biosynthesis